MARHAHEVLIRALQLGGLAGIVVGVSQVLWSQAGSGGGAAGMFTKDPTVIAASTTVLLLVYLAMVRCPTCSIPHFQCISVSADSRCGLSLHHTCVCDNVVHELAGHE